MDNTLYQLKGCFREDFSKWLIKSNNHLINKLLAINAGISNESDRMADFWKEFNKIEEKSLQDILNIILREPEADYFFYVRNTKDRDIFNVKFDLYYHVPTGEPQPVPGESIRVDGDKIKALLRDIKINTILDYEE